MSKNTFGYKLDLAAQTLTLTAAFAEAANDPTSAEYELVQQFKNDFPRLIIKRQTHRKPKKYKNKNGTITKCNQFKNLTYERMERFMGALPNSAEYLEAYYALREKAEAMCPSPYSAVSQWFMKQFPKFRTNPLFYIENEAEIIDFADILEKFNDESKKASETKERSA